MPNISCPVFLCEMHQIGPETSWDASGPRSLAIHASESIAYYKLKNVVQRPNVSLHLPVTCALRSRPR